MVGFPHSEILGSKLIRSSPGLIAAYYVLHRLHAPRHPLDALKALDRSHYLYPQHIRPLLKGRLVIGQRTKDHVSQHGRLIGQIKKNQNSRAVAVSLPGCGIKQAAKHLFTMSKDPAAEPLGVQGCQTCSLTMRRWFRCWVACQPKLLLEQRRLVEPDGIEPTTFCLQSRRSPN